MPGSVLFYAFVVASFAASGNAAPLVRLRPHGEKKLSVLDSNVSALGSIQDLAINPTPGSYLGPAPGPAPGAALYAPSAGPAPSPMPAPSDSGLDVDAGVEFIFKINGLSYNKLKSNVTLWNAVVDTIQELTVKMVGHSYVHAKDVHVDFSRGFLVAHVRVIPPQDMSAEHMLPLIDASIPQFSRELERKLEAIQGIELAKTADISVTLIAGPKVRKHIPSRKKESAEAAPQLTPAYAPQPTVYHRKPCKEAAPQPAPAYHCPDSLSPKSHSATLVVNTMLLGLSTLHLGINDMNC